MKKFQKLGTLLSKDAQKGISGGGALGCKADLQRCTANSECCSKCCGIVVVTPTGNYSECGHGAAC